MGKGVVVAVAATVGVAVGARVGTGVGVMVGVMPGVDVGVGVSVAAGVGVAVGVSVAAGVAVGVAVGVEVGDATVSMREASSKQAQKLPRTLWVTSTRIRTCAVPGGAVTAAVSRVNVSDTGCEGDCMVDSPALPASRKSSVSVASPALPELASIATWIEAA